MIIVSGQEPDSPGFPAALSKCFEQQSDWGQAQTRALIATQAQQHEQKQGSKSNKRNMSFGPHRMLISSQDLELRGTSTWRVYVIGRPNWQSLEVQLMELVKDFLVHQKRMLQISDIPQQPILCHVRAVVQSCLIQFDMHWEITTGQLSFWECLRRPPIHPRETESHLQAEYTSDVLIISCPRWEPKVGIQNIRKWSLLTPKKTLIFL